MNKPVEIFESNTLIERGYKHMQSNEDNKTTPLSITGNRILNLILSKVSSKDSRVIKLTRSEMLKKLNMRFMDSSELKKFMSDTNSVIFTTEDGGEELNFSFFEAIGVKDGIYKFHLNRHLMPLITGQTKNFTVTNLNILRSLKSSRAITVYKLLKRYHYLGERYFTIEEFRSKLGLKAKTYDNAGRIVDKIVKPIVENLTQFSDLDGLTYHTEYLGGRISRIIFRFTKHTRDRRVIKLPKSRVSDREYPKTNITESVVTIGVWDLD